MEKLCREDFVLMRGKEFLEVPLYITEYQKADSHQYRLVREIEKYQLVGQRYLGFVYQLVVPVQRLSDKHDRREHNQNQLVPELDYHLDKHRITYALYQLRHCLSSLLICVYCHYSTPVRESHYTFSVDLPCIMKNTAANDSRTFQKGENL